MKEHFEEVVFVWSARLNRDIILKEDPDILIYEVVERNVDLLRCRDIFNCPFAAQKFGF